MMTPNGSNSYPNAILSLQNQNLTGGANVTSYNLGTPVNGSTVGIICGYSPLQYLVNNVAGFTIAAPTTDGSCLVSVVNGSSAGSISFSGFTTESSHGDAFDTVDGHAFTISIWCINGIADYRVAAQGPAITMRHVASASGIGVNTVTVALPPGGIPAGMVFGVLVADTSNTGGSITTSGGDSFETIQQQGPGNAVTALIGIAATGNALVAGAAGATITYTLGQPGKNATVEAFYVCAANLSLGDNVLDLSSFNGTSGTSATPSVTSGVPTKAGELFIGFVASASSVASFTQDSIDAAWGAPPGLISIAAPTLVGGSFVNPTSGAMTYAPTLGTSVAWAALIVSIIPN